MSKSSSGGLVSAFMGPFRAWHFAREQKGLTIYFIIPFLLNIVLLTAILYLSYTFIYPFTIGIVPEGSAWYLKALRWIITPIFVLINAFIVVILYSISGNILTAPFNDPLSARVEKILTGEDIQEQFTFSSFIRDIVRITLNVVKLLILLILYSLIIMLLNLIPIVGSICYSILSMLGTAFFLGFQFFDFPLERRKLVFREKLKILWKKKSLVIGLGGGFFVISLIPVFGFLGLNLATIAATILYVDCIRPELVRAPQSS